MNYSAVLYKVGISAYFRLFVLKGGSINMFFRPHKVDCLCLLVLRKETYLSSQLRTAKWKCVIKCNQYNIYTYNLRIYCPKLDLCLSTNSVSWSKEISQSNYFLNFDYYIPKMYSYCVTIFSMQIRNMYSLKSWVYVKIKCIISLISTCLIIL